MTHVIVISPNQPKDGLLKVIADVLTTDGLLVIRKRVITIMGNEAFYMEGTAKNPKNRKLGDIPAKLTPLRGRCYVYLVEEAGDDELHISNTMKEMTKHYGSVYVSESASETIEMEKLLFS